MDLSLQQAAALMSKSVRQVRYMIAQGTLQATRTGRVWRIRQQDLPLSEAQQGKATRRRASLVNTAVRALGGGPNDRSSGYSFTQIRAASALLPLYRDAIITLS